jgi:hypothetical protein
MSFNINPCFSSVKNSEKLDINSINNTCYDICSAFSDVTNEQCCRNNCDICIKDTVVKMGRDLCEFRPAKPPVFVQVPHYFPGFFKETNNVEESLNRCIKSCDNLRINNNECIQNCKIDKDAVEVSENYRKGGECMCKNCDCPCRHGGDCMCRNRYSKESINPVLSFIIYVLILIITFMIIKGICQSLVEVKEY